MPSNLGQALIVHQLYRIGTMHWGDESGTSTIADEVGRIINNFSLLRCTWCVCPTKSIGIYVLTIYSHSGVLFCQMSVI